MKETKISLSATKRTLFGKKLKALRKKGILPANIYGEGFTSEAIELPLKEFSIVYKKSGETQIVYLQVGSNEYPVLIQHVQYDPIHDGLLHVDFRKVNLKKKIETHVPVLLVGESEAVAQNKGILLTLTESLLVEALPDSIPAHIELDISKLKELNDEIKVSDLGTSADYVFKDEPEKVIVRISEHKEEEVTPQIVAPETVEITGGAKETEEGTEEVEEESKPKEKEEVKEEK